MSALEPGNDPAPACLRAISVSVSRPAETLARASGSTPFRQFFLERERVITKPHRPPERHASGVLDQNLHPDARCVRPVVGDHPLENAPADTAATALLAHPQLSDVDPLRF